MVTFLFTSILLLAGLIVLVLYFWQKPNRKRLDRFESETNVLPPSESRGLFIGANTHNGITTQIEPTAKVKDLSALITRAGNDDKSALPDAANHSDKTIYEQVLNEFVESVDSDPKLLSLLSFVVGHELPVNRRLAEAVIDSWKTAPDRPSTAKMLHIAALADVPEIYQGAVEAALQFWRAGRIPDLSAIELQSLFDGEFWVLSSDTRRTGSGFILKRTLASARRELESAARVNK